MSIKEKAIVSIQWTTLGQFTGLGIRLLSNLLMTTILAPDVYGITAIAIGILMTLNMVTDIGISQSVIRAKHSSNKDFLNTAWTLQVIRNTLLSIINLAIAVIVYFLAKNKILPIESALNNPTLPLVLCATSCIVLLDGFKSMNFILVQKSMNFGGLIKLEFLGQALSVPLMYSLAINDFGVWSLIAGNAFSSVIILIGSYKLKNTPIHRFKLLRVHVVEILNFGKWIFASSLFTAIFLLGDRFIIGSLFTSEMLGLYSIAILWINALRGLINTTVNRVGFPVLTAFVNKEDKGKVLLIFYKIKLILNLTVTFLISIIFFYAEVLINAFYRDEYTYSGKLLSILSLSLFSCIVELRSKLLLSYGDSKSTFFGNFTKATIFIISAIIGYNFFGIEGIIGSLFLATICNEVHLLIASNALGLIIINRELKITLASATVFLATYLLKQTIS